MSEPLDSTLEALKGESPDHRLDQLEPAVWLRIESVRRTRASYSVFLPVRVAAVIGALGIGVAGGGLAAAQVSAERQEISVFSVNSHLAPSSLLDGH